MEFPAPQIPSWFTLPHRSHCTECKLVAGSIEEMSTFPSGKVNLMGVVKGITG
jgi:hypothetical protein